MSNNIPFYTVNPFRDEVIKGVFKDTSGDVARYVITEPLKEMLDFKHMDEVVFSKELTPHVLPHLEGFEVSPYVLHHVNSNDLSEYDVEAYSPRYIEAVVELYKHHPVKAHLVSLVIAFNEELVRRAKMKEIYLVFQDRVVIACIETEHGRIKEFVLAKGFDETKVLQSAAVMIEKDHVNCFMHLSTNDYLHPFLFYKALKSE